MPGTATEAESILYEVTFSPLKKMCVRDLTSKTEVLQLPSAINISQILNIFEKWQNWENVEKN